MSKIDYNELVEFVRTHDEYYVAEFMFADNKRIAELEQDLEFTTKTSNELIEIKHKLEQELAELKEKDNYHLRYELAGADETITNLKKQIKENGKEINTKNNKLAELKKELTICKDTLRRKTQSNRDLQHRVHNVNTQLAIQELEKVNGILTDTIIEVTQDEFDLNKLCYLEEISARFYEKMQQQIKELKGE